MEWYIQELNLPIAVSTGTYQVLIRTPDLGNEDCLEFAAEAATAIGLFSFKHSRGLDSLPSTPTKVWKVAYGTTSNASLSRSGLSPFTKSTPPLPPL